MQVLGAGQLARRVAFQRELRVLRSHAGSVVGDGDEVAAAAADLDAHARRTGVERVLDELLDHGSRAFDHLAGGDLVDERIVESAHARRVGHAPPSLTRYHGIARPSTCKQA